MAKQITSAQWVQNEGESALVFFSDGSIKVVEYSETAEDYQMLRQWETDGGVIGPVEELTPIDGLQSMESARNTVAKIIRCACRWELKEEDWEFDERKAVTDGEKCLVEHRCALEKCREEKIKMLETLETMQELREFLLGDSCHFPPSPSIIKS